MFRAFGSPQLCAKNSLDTNAQNSGTLRCARQAAVTAKRRATLSAASAVATLAPRAVLGNREKFQNP